MKKIHITLSVLMIISILFPLFAADFGLNIGNITDFSKKGQNELNQTNTAALWLTTPIKDFTLSGSIVYKFNYAWNPAVQTIKPFQIDVGSLEFGGFVVLPGENPSGLRFDIGRIQASDVTGSVFSAKSDGFNAAWIYKNISLGAQLYYTGLTLKSNSAVVLSPQDAADRSVDTVLFGPPRIVYSLYALFQEFALRQSFNIEAMGQNDLRIAADPRVHSYYGIGRLSGPLFSTVRYSLGTSFGILQNAQTFNFGQLILANVSMRIPAIKTNLTLSGIYSMPWDTENTTGFVPVNAQSLSIVMPELKHNNVTFIGFDAAWQPASFFSGGIKTNAYLKQNASPLPLSVLRSDSTSLFVGTEFSFYGSFIVSSEFSFMVSSGLFIINPFSVVEGTNIAPFRLSVSGTLKI